MVLQHKDLLPLPSQRVAAMFLLHELYRSEQPNGNPFSQFFVELLQPQVVDDRTVVGVVCGHALSSVEKWFLAHLLSSPSPKDVSSLNLSLSLSLSLSRCLFLPQLFKKTAAAIASTDPSSLQVIYIT